MTAVHQLILALFLIYLFATFENWLEVYFKHEDQGQIPRHACDTKVPAPLNHEWPSWVIWI